MATKHQSEQPSPPQQQQQQRQQQEDSLQIERLSSDNFINSTQELLADAYTGRDVTRPRDLYAFLSLGHIPDSTNNRRLLLQSRSVNADYKRVTFDVRDSVSRRKSFDGGERPSHFLQLDLRKSPLIPLPSIKSSHFPQESKEGDLCEQIVAEELARTIQDNIPISEGDVCKQIVAEELARKIQDNIPISVAKGYHKVNLSTTYIFTPQERLQEAVKYSTKVVLPRIPPKAPGTADFPPPSVLTIDSQNNVEALHKKKFEVVSLSPKRNIVPPIPPGTHVFGMRPECMFINTQLGDKNPLLRDTNKTSMASKVPKAVPGLQDLKDYDCYPEVYWKVRAETITQPRDLEADMIDRDLYRLRQISNLKLNTIERTFQVKQDPFRKWRGKAGEPLFSPKQQKPPQRKRVEKTKATENSLVNPTDLNVSQLSLEVIVTPLRLTEPDHQTDDKCQDGALSTSRSNVGHNAKEPSSGKIDATAVECPDLPTFDTPLEASAEITPREAVEVSLNTYRRLQEERDTEENFNFGKVTAQKLHQMKNNKESRKQAIKTSLVRVDFDPVDAYNMHHRGASWRQQQLSDRKYHTYQNDTGVLYSYRKGDDSGKTTDRSVPPNTTNGAQNGPKSNSDTYSDGGRQAPVASVATLLFKPPANYKVPGSYPDALDPTVYGNYGNEGNGEYSDLYMQQGILHPSPEALGSEAGSGIRAGGKNAGSPMKAVRLEVFSERKPDMNGPIKIPTGRTSYDPVMPAYRLDLRNYPPRNARQVCRRSNSAGVPDSRQTQLTQATLESLHRELSSCRVQAHTATASSRGAEVTTQPPRSADVDIRFGGTGEVILASRDLKRGRNGRVSR